METEILEKDRLKKEVQQLKDALVNFEKRENILRDTLIAAQKFANEIKKNANKESELAVKEAEIKSEEIINTAIARQRELREEIRSLKFKRRELEEDILHMLNSLKSIIESYREEDENFDKVEYIG